MEELKMDGLLMIKRGLNRVKNIGASLWRLQTKVIN